jgi:hypothetical protein
VSASAIALANSRLSSSPDLSSSNFSMMSCSRLSEPPAVSALTCGY